MPEAQEPINMGYLPAGFEPTITRINEVAADVRTESQSKREPNPLERELVDTLSRTDDIALEISAIASRTDVSERVRAMLNGALAIRLLEVVDHVQGANIPNNDLTATAGEELRASRVAIEEILSLVGGIDELSH